MLPKRKVVRMKCLKGLSWLLVAATFLISPSLAASKKVRVVCTLPTLRSLAEEIGGDRVEVISLAKGDQDPAFCDADAGAHEKDP